MHKKVDRARLFLSYDALKGFKELLQEDTTIPRKELCEDQYYELDWKIHQIQEGDEIELIHYTGYSYSKIRGIIQTVNLEDRYIYINDHKIQLKNICSLEL
ncbi:YolD-like family protein [uncultured Catenibacterium sp.]|uniref:YolD-like family protein n=1 Tax=uncultured Catenibacterium sp. TaxID=286142 RepID=UPI0025D33542|nr:YolD-like family protein [uncultured Catenibacterium sp.]